MASYNISDRERIARLEQAERDIRSDIDEIKRDVKSILATLSAMSGGRKALLGLATILGTLMGAVASAVAIFGFGHR